MANKSRVVPVNLKFDSEMEKAAIRYMLAQNLEEIEKYGGGRGIAPYARAATRYCIDNVSPAKLSEYWNKPVKVKS